MGLLVYVKALRVRESSLYVFIPFATILLSFFLLGIPVSLAEGIGILLVMELFSLYSFCSNNYFDKDVDADNPVKVKKNPYSSGKISRRGMLGLNGLLLAGMFFLTWMWFPSAALALGLFVINVTLYSKYFKRKPLVDMASHFGWVVSFFLFPAIVLGIPLELIVLFSLIVFGVSNLAEIEENQLLDLEADRKAGVRSTAVFLGKGAAKGISFASLGIVFFGLVWASFLLEIPMFLVFLPLVVLNGFRIANRDFLGKMYEPVFFGGFILLLTLVGIAGL